MTALPFTAETVFRFRDGRDEIAATAVGALGLPGRSRVVLIDTAERHWVVEVSADGRMTQVVAGPITGGEALHAAEKVIAGIPDHGSATALVQMLAVGLVASTLALTQAEGRAA
ncbi:hypothetical protein [Paramagnetospirillum magneticum]|uniref:Uncharacterized protein n=1 Tax=Paramagnetospirillum magneticum (strain ATCC 700264 / AMB-1) TaxID=342108 RepID=Q2WA70_PARM1|nr:hypothetical protein [Paramagnetospirillum magneticum]BAE49255.1 hypothetical protein amb0451 [Paramagnetospirillum magneticum AMB-1]